MNLLCSYPRDGHSTHEWCDPPGVSEDCLPGCWDHAYPPESLREMMEEQESHGPHEWQPPEDEGDLLLSQGRYNELVLESAAWVDRLPSTIIAVFYLRIGHGGTEEARDYAQRVHAAYAREFGLAAGTVPLLVYDPARNATAPFEMAPDAGG